MLLRGCMRWTVCLCLMFIQTTYCIARRSQINIVNALNHNTRSGFRRIHVDPHRIELSQFLSGLKTQLHSYYYSWFCDDSKTDSSKIELIELCNARELQLNTWKTLTPAMRQLIYWVGNSMADVARRASTLRLSAFRKVSTTTIVTVTKSDGACWSLHPYSLYVTHRHR